MAIAYVQSAVTITGGGAPATTVAATAAAAVGSGNLVVGMITIAGGFTVNSVSDDKGNTYTILDHVSDPAGQENYSFYLGNITNGPTTITATLNGSDSFRGMVWDEFSGIAALANPTDGHAANLQGIPSPAGTDAITSTAITPTQSGDLIWGSTVNSNNSDLPSLGTGFTASGTDGPGTPPVPIVNEYLIQGTAAPIAATFSESISGDSFSTFIIAFKAAVAAAAPLVAPLLSPPRGIGRGPSGPFAHTVMPAAVSPGGSAISLLASSLGAAWGRLGFTGNAALAARSAAEGEGGAAITGNAALAATSAGQGKATLNFTGKLGLAARSLGTAIGRLSPPGTSALVSLFARAVGMGAGRAGMTGAAALKAASIGEGQGRNTPTFKAQLAAATRAAGVGKLGNMTGKVGLAARSLAAATGQALPPGAHAVLQLIANGFAMAAGRLRLIGTVPLAGASRSSAQGRAQPRVNAVLATISKAAGQARAGTTFAARMAASSAAHGAGKATVAARAALSSVGKAMTTGAANPAGRVALLGRTIAQSKSVATLASVVPNVGVAAAGFAMSVGRAILRIFAPSPRVAIAPVEDRIAAPSAEIRSAFAASENRTVIAPPMPNIEEASAEDRIVIAPSKN